MDSFPVRLLPPDEICEPNKRIVSFGGRPHSCEWDESADEYADRFSSYLVLGASPVAAAIALMMTGIFDLFVHSDISTPRWVGYIVQRPEMHTVRLNRHTPCNTQLFAIQRT